MIDANDLLEMQADLLAVRGDNASSIVIRRGTTTLAAQTVRVAGAGYSERRSNSGTTLEARNAVVILGATTLDVQVDDRFTLTVATKPVLFRVTWVRPERRVATMAKAEAVE